MDQFFAAADTLEVGEPLGIMRKGFWEDFDGHVAPELGVMRFVNFPHAARANLRDEPGTIRGKFVGTVRNSIRHPFPDCDIISRTRQTGPSELAGVSKTLQAGRNTVKSVWIVIFILIATWSFGQTPSGSFPPTTSMKQLMLDMIYPASNDMLLLIYRGGPKDENEWAAARRNAMTLAESGNLLMMPGRMRDQGDWMKHVKMLVDIGTAAYKAAEEKNVQALAEVAGPLDASCTSCHKLYRPNVFPRQGGSK